jgi:hypothetical protein
VIPKVKRRKRLGKDTEVLMADGTIKISEKRLKKELQRYGYDHDFHLGDYENGEDFLTTKICR